MTEEFNHSIEEASESAWLLPPNTMCYFGADDTKSFHYLYLLLKRAKKYWDNQWNDIIRETTEHLNSIDKYREYIQECPGVVFGADDPYVILTVGFEVRMFKWEQGFEGPVNEGARMKMSPRSALRELTPGKVLNPFEEKKDGDEIEKFLVLAGQHSEAIKARIEREGGGERQWWHGRSGSRG